MKPLDLLAYLFLISVSLWGAKVNFVDPYLDPACVQGIPGDYKPN